MWNVDLLDVSKLQSEVMAGMRKMGDQVGREKTGIGARVAFHTLFMEFDDERRKSLKAEAVAHCDVHAVHPHF